MIMQPHLLLQSFHVFNSLTFPDVTDVAKQHNLFLQIFGQSDNKRPGVSIQTTVALQLATPASPLNHVNG